MLPVRYEDLVADPSGEMARILAHLHLPVDMIPSALRAFEVDSQAGSPISRQEASRHNAELDASEWAAIRELIRRYPLRGIDVPAATLAIT
jgi:hypothetical protein